ncbi:MAG: tetratricopeptide repeat protein [Acidobacteriota bacterium]
MKSLLVRLFIFLSIVIFAIVVTRSIYRNGMGEIYYNVGAGKDYLETAIQYRAAHPEAYYQLGLIYLYDFNASDNRRAVTALAQAVTLSPNDYSYWLALGKAFELGGSLVEARTAFEHALKLAPNYYDPAFESANFYYRIGERELAREQFSHALTQAPRWEFYNILISSWQAVERDYEIMLKLVPAAVEPRVRFTEFLVTQKRLPEACQTLLLIPKAERAAYRGVLRQVIDSSINAREFELADKTWRAYTEMAADLNIYNGGFETDIVNFGFDWQVIENKNVIVRVDEDLHREGVRSLDIRFDNAENIAYELVTKYVPVKSGSSYRLSFAVRSEKLLNESMPFIEITDQLTTAPIVTESAASAHQGWQERELTFKSPPTTGVVKITIRRKANESFARKFIGEVWYDNFRLDEIAN